MLWKIIIFYISLEIVPIETILSKKTFNDYRMNDGEEKTIINPIINKAYYFTIQVNFNDKIMIKTSLNNIINNNLNIFSVFFYESQSYYPYLDYKKKDCIILSVNNNNVTNNSFYVSKIINDTDVNFLTYELIPKFNIDYFSVKVQIINSISKTFVVIIIIFFIFYCSIFVVIVFKLINCYRKSHSYPLNMYEPINQHL